MATPVKSYDDDDDFQDPQGNDLGEVLAPPEKREELQSIYFKDTIDWKREFFNDPLFPFWFFIYRYTLPGFGMLTEGYVIFSNGNLKTLYKQAYPECWKTYEVCNEHWVHAVDYLQITGILVGQVVMGVFADVIGRRKIWIANALIMFLGVMLIIFSTGYAIGLNNWIIFYAWAFFLYGFGVGGEYPVSASVAAESSESARTQKERDSRGKNVTLVFLHQGWGQLINAAALCVLMIVYNTGSGTPPYSQWTTDAIWRTSYALAAPFILYLAYWRIWRVKENKNYEKVKKAMNSKLTKEDNARRRSIMMTMFWPRLVASMGGWFINDVGFYGGKIFMGDIIKVIVGPSASVLTYWLFTLGQTAVQMVGYYMAAFLIDKKWYGRYRMQMVGFGAMFILYTITASTYGWMSSPAGVRVYAFIFYFQSFWQQFGPNCTTFLVPVETFPTVTRATSHGASAAAGKLGALFSEIVFTYISNNAKVWMSAWGNFLGLVITFVFLNDTTGLNLEELDRYFKHLENGTPDDYHGDAINPKHISFYERVVLKWNKNFDLEQDARDKQAERSTVMGKLSMSMKRTVGYPIQADDSDDDQDFKPVV